MPNPNMAKAVASYAGSMNIREYLCVVWPTLVAGRASQTHEIQRPKIYERFGSATRLKAGSHPIGGRESVVTTGDGTVGIFFEARGNRSPLWVRASETMTDRMLEAAPAPCTAAAKPVTARQLTTPTTATFLTARRLTRCAKIAVLFVSISDAPWQGN